MGRHDGNRVFTRSKVLTSTETVAARRKLQLIMQGEGQHRAQAASSEPPDDGGNLLPICLGILTYHSGVPWDLIASSGIAGG
jgi:hypothetical protein